MRKLKSQKPCPRCGGPKPRGGRKTCDNCKPVDACWRQLTEDPEKGCWLWTGKALQGYGMYSNRLVHRLVYEALIAEIPEGLDLDHLCLVTLCANPWHLEPVTRSENSRRKWANYTHCKSGHEFTPESTYIDRRGHRNCRPCTNRSQKECQQRKREKAVS
jgi:hypothetical protein